MPKGDNVSYFSEEVAEFDFDEYDFPHVCVGIYQDLGDYDSSF